MFCSKNDKVRVYAFADEANGMIDRQIEAMKRNALNGLEIRNVDGTNVSDITLEKAKEVKNKLDRRIHLGADSEKRFPDCPAGAGGRR